MGGRFSHMMGGFMGDPKKGNMGGLKLKVWAKRWAVVFCLIVGGFMGGQTFSKGETRF